MSKKIHNTLSQDAIIVTEIGAATKVNPDELIIQNIEYMLATFEWLWFNDTALHQNHVDPFWSTELKIHNDIELPYALSDGAIVINKIKSIVFNEWDFQVAKEQIDAIYADTL